MIYQKTFKALKRMVILCALINFALPLTATAKENISVNDAFVSAAFKGTPPNSKTLWLDERQKKAAKKILRHNYKALRVRYWQVETKTVWILNEVGKYKPITIGVVVVDRKITKLSVLAYRESHGWQVKHDFFTKQFIGSHLSKKSKLSENIDGISGATLSVRALKKLARLSLYFDTQV